MTPLEALNVSRAALESLCKRYHVQELSVFGSMARGQAGPDRDVDLLVVFDKDAHVTLFTLFELQSDLSELLGRPVDLVPKNGLKRALRSEVLAEAKILYAA